MQRVFVKVLGFSDVERHALNTLFRLSQERGTAYALWSAECGAAARMALIDSESHEAVVEFESPSNQELKMIWIGRGAPPQAWRSFERPIQWPDVIEAMDQFFVLPPELDVDLGEPQQEAPDTVPPEPGPPRRALIAAADRDERLYLRARLSLAGLPQADEAETAAEALELARLNSYSILLVDFALAGDEGWDFLRQLRGSGTGRPRLIVTKPGFSALEKLRALWSGRPALLAKPPDPGKFKALLERA